MVESLDQFIHNQSQRDMILNARPSSETVRQIVGQALPAASDA